MLLSVYVILDKNQTMSECRWQHRNWRVEEFTFRNQVLGELGYGLGIQLLFNEGHICNFKINLYREDKAYLKEE